LRLIRLRQLTFYLAVAYASSMVRVCLTDVEYDSEGSRWFD
jgi:hypothetical protein